jgi:hypothetical protein
MCMYVGPQAFSVNWTGVCVYGMYVGGWNAQVEKNMCM